MEHQKLTEEVLIALVGDAPRHWTDAMRAEARILQHRAWEALPAALQAPSIMHVFDQTLHTMEYEIARTRMEFAHVAIQPDLSDFLWTETHRSRELIRAGEHVAEQYVPQIKALLPFFTQLGKVPQRPSSPLRP